jgi:thiamine-phosphate pyrophosphorylase
LRRSFARGPILLLHLVTDRRRLSGSSTDADRARDCLLRQAKHAIEARIDVLQIRERDLEAAMLARLVSEIVALARGTHSRVVVNDRLDVALACGAAGVHLPADSIAPARARAIAPPGFVVGRSVHSVQEAVAVARDVDYLIAGTVWPSESKGEETPLLGLSGLSAVVRNAGVPVLAIGGLTVARVASVRAAGAAGVAAIGMFMGAPDERGCRAVALAETAEAARVMFDTVGPTF